MPHSTPEIGWQTGHHIAQANIARARAPLDDPLMQGFVDQLEDINRIADGSPGFVWRLQEDGGDATGVRPFEDPLIIVNMSVWTSVGHLYRYVFESGHREPLRARASWFEKLDRPHSVLWWVPAGHIPDVAEMVDRLDLLRDNGPGPEAFTFAAAFRPDGRPMERPRRMGRACA